MILKLLLLLLPLVAAASCPWSTCHTVEVQNVLMRDSNSHSAAGPVGYRMLTARQCSPSNHFPERCHVHEAANRPDRVLNFTMRRAQLTEVPLSGLCLFEQLSGLDVAENSIAEFNYPTDQLADEPRCLRRLSWLNLRANLLRTADISQFLQLPGLQQLDLSDNRQLESIYLSQAPSLSKGGSATLKTILASRCRIKQVDIGLVRLPSLQDIDLSYNRVSRVTNRLRWALTPSEVAKIAAERNSRRARDPNYYARLSVQLVQNQIGPEAFADGKTLWGLPVPSLTSESAADTDAVVNALKFYRDAFRSFLYIDNTDSTVTCDCRLLPAWSFLRRVHRDPDEFSKRNALSLDYWLRLRCDPESLSEGRYFSRRNITSLEDTDLVCRHVRDCPTGCTCVERVMPSELTMDCRGAGLSSLPGRLPASVHPVRYNLLLADNRINSLQSAQHLANASLVQRLDLSRNRISAGTDFSPLAALTGLHWLNLSGNPMHSLPPSLLSLAGDGLTAPARIDLGPGVTVRCRCAQLEPDSWERQRRLLGDGIRTLRCVGINGLPESPAEFRHRECVQRANSSSPDVVKEHQIVDQSFVLWVGVGSVLLFVLVLVGVVFAVLRYRRSGPDPDKVPTPPLPPPVEATLPAVSSLAPMPQQVAAGVGCCSPPYDTMMMAQPRYSRTPASGLLLLRGGDCGVAAARGSADFCRRRTELGLGIEEDDSDDLSTGDEDEGAVVRGFGISGGSDPAMAGARCSRHLDAWGGGRGVGLRNGQPMLEHELLLPPPLPPRTQPPLQCARSMAGVPLATDV